MKGAGEPSTHVNSPTFADSTVCFLDDPGAFSEYRDEDPAFVDLYLPYSSVAQDLTPRYRSQHLTVCVNGPCFHSYITPCSCHQRMIGSLIAVSFGLRYSIANG